MEYIPITIINRHEYDYNLDIAIGYTIICESLTFYVGVIPPDSNFDDLNKWIDFTTSINEEEPEMFDIYDNADDYLKNKLLFNKYYNFDEF